jgi:TonB family protein
MAAGEGGSLASALDTISRANEFVVTAHWVTGAILLLVAGSALAAIWRPGPRTKAMSSLGVLAVAAAGMVVLGALALSPLVDRSLAFPLAVIASDDGTPIQNPALRRTRQAFDDLQVQDKNVGEVSATVARYLLATALGSFALLPLSILALVLILVSSEKTAFPRALAVGGFVIAVLGTLVSAERFVHHRGLAQEIALVRENWEAPPAPLAEKPKTVILEEGKEVVAPVKIRDVAPVCPQEAIRARVEGKVVVEAIIDVYGNVQEVKILESIPLLDDAALEAVKQWKYTPATVDGKPSPIVMTVNVNFELN